MIENFTEQESEQIYKLLGEFSMQFPIDSEEFYLLTKERAEVRGRM